MSNADFYLTAATVRLLLKMQSVSVLLRTQIRKSGQVLAVIHNVPTWAGRMEAGRFEA